MVSRALAIYFSAWMLSDITYVPAMVYSFFHHVSRAGAFGTDAYWGNYDAIALSFHATRICALLLAARWFYRGGPAVHGLLWGSTGIEDSGSD